jgi:hypothetical protein
MSVRYVTGFFRNKQLQLARGGFAVEQPSCVAFGQLQG